MTTITIGNTAGNFDFNVMDLDFKTFLDQGFKNFEADIGKGVQTVKLIQKDGDFIELLGHFNMSGLLDRDRLKAVEDIESLSVGHGDQVNYAISNLDLSKADLKTDKTLAAFADAQVYKILGNASENILAGGLRGDQLYGNSGNDELYGGNGNDKLYGGNDDDVLSGGNQDDTLYGDAGNDRLDGGDGDDSLTGGSGKNVLTGGDDNDTYYLGAGDKIVEEKGKAAGFDTVIAATNIDLDKFRNVEALELDGKGNLNGTGNDDDNTLTGNEGNNKLDGGKGIDRMIGGEGNDTYVVDNAKDIVIETGKKDHDTIDATVSINLSKLSTIEDVFLFGKADLDATGNAGDNTLSGNAGDNTLRGAGGNDTLTGGDGSDTFVFQKGDKTDTITDFDASGKDHDVLDLSEIGKVKFANLDIEKFGKDGLDIDFGHGDHLILEHVKIKDIDINDFQF
ncbi:MAG: Hemolysin-type calcium binding domain protein [Rhizobium sp.]|nr:Hemolysin-type calcium binding domain protein [Rhizobium sp.]